jgi:hypothetical protein
VSLVSRAIAAAAAAMLLTSCAGGRTTTSPGAATQTPVVNLSGYSAAYKRGHGDACAQRRDERLMREQGDYMMGWNDGRLVCSRR